MTPPLLHPSLRLAIVLGFLAVWLLVVIAYLLQHRLPDAALLAIPPAVLAFIPVRRPDPAAPDPAADQSGEANP